MNIEDNRPFRKSTLSQSAENFHPPPLQMEEPQFKHGGCQTDRPRTSSSQHAVVRKPVGVMRASLALLDDFARKFHREGDELDSMRFMEKALLLRREMSAISAEELQQCAELFVIRCNVLAMKFLKASNPVMSIQFLKKAEFVTNEEEQFFEDSNLRLKLRAATYNNMGCFYLKRNKVAEAYDYLTMALDVESMCKDIDNPGATHLNMCAVLSKMKRHVSAFRHAKAALESLQDTQQSNRRRTTGELSMAAVAYHNMAVQKECMKKYKDAVELYAKASFIAERDLGLHHPTTIAIQNDYYKCKMIWRRKIAYTEKIRARQQVWMRLACTNIRPKITRSGDVIFPSPSPKKEEKKEKSPKRTRKKKGSHTKQLDPESLPPLRRVYHPMMDPSEEQMKGVLFGNSILT